MPNLLPQLPPLESLHDRPSWTAWSGRIDRSACMEITAAAVLRELKPQFTPAKTTAGREARAQFTINTRLLQHWRDRLMPRRLQGDFRWKSHAMQPTNKRIWDRNNRFRRSLKSSRLPPYCTVDPFPMAVNPNFGAAASKILGLPLSWSTALTIERWRIGTIPETSAAPPNLASCAKWDRAIRRHYLRCPGSRSSTIPVWKPDPRRITPTKLQRFWWGLDKPPYSEPCTGKTYKLFLPLCTEREYLDSLLALNWLNLVASLRAQRLIPAAGTRDEALLIDRYALLFHPRIPLCRRCLGIHYGKVKALSKRRARAGSS